MDGRSLIRLGQDQLAAARAGTSGRAALTVYGGHEHRMRQTLLALVDGACLHEHEAPREATVQVLIGEVRLDTVDGDAWRGRPGDQLTIPPQRHSVEALSDAVILLTVVTRD